MTNNNWETVGKNIRDIVQSAVDSQDFQKLNQTISSAMSSAIKEMEKGIRDAGEKANQQQDKNIKEKKYQSSTMKPPYSQTMQRNYPNLFARTTKNQVIGIILIVIGFGMGALFAFAFLGILLGTLFLIKHVAMFTLLIIFGSLFALFMLLGYQGMSMYSQTRRFQGYIRGLGGKTYANIDQLAYEVHKSVGFVRNDIVKMIQKGWFIEGHLDRQGQCLMITHETYNEYLKTVQQSQSTQTKVKNDGMSQEVREVLEIGNTYIKEIHQCNDDIPGIEISEKISRMELIVQKIFKRIEQHPENIPDIRKFMKYYLPTTVKLLKAYRELDQQPIQGENIINSKREIENTLDTLNYAFEKLLDDLFRDTAWDVSSDVSVLETLLAQEGLTKKGL